MNTHAQTKKHLLNSGIPCTIHNCVKCCIETRMPLSRIDIERESPGRDTSSKILSLNVKESVV